MGHIGYSLQASVLHLGCNKSRRNGVQETLSSESEAEAEAWVAIDPRPILNISPSFGLSRKPVGKLALVQVNRRH